MEAMPVDPVPESLGARWPAEKSVTDVDVLGGGERLAAMADGSVAMPAATAETIGSSEAVARVADATPESSADKPMAPKEQTMLPEASKGMVGHAIRPPSLQVQPSCPQVVPPAIAEEDEVEEIKHDEPRP